MLNVHSVLMLNLVFPEMCIFIQKRHPYTGNLISETPEDSENAFLQMLWLSRWLDTDASLSCTAI